jgi:hypothetical protein
MDTLINDINLSKMIGSSKQYTIELIHYKKGYLD